jgi:hypothetical protein
MVILCLTLSSREKNSYNSNTLARLFSQGGDMEINVSQEMGKVPVSRIHIKLFNPSVDVNKVLDTVGFKQFLEIYQNLG